MTSTETRAAVTVGDATGSRRSSRHYAPEQRRSLLLTVLLWLLVLYFVLPLWWLLVSSTKDNAAPVLDVRAVVRRRLLALGEPADPVHVRDGIFTRWLRQHRSSTRSARAVGATLLSTMAGYAFAKYEFPGKKALFSITLGAIMIPLTALAMPTYLLFSSAGLTDTPVGGHPPVAGQPVRRLPHAGVRRRRRSRTASSRRRESMAPASSGSSGRWASACSGPGIVTVFLFSLVATWNNYFLPLIMLNSWELLPAHGRPRAAPGGGGRAAARRRCSRP